MNYKHSSYSISIFVILLINSFISLYAFYVVGFFSVVTYLPQGWTIFRDQFRMDYTIFAMRYFVISTTVILIIYFLKVKVLYKPSKRFVVLMLYIIIYSIFLNHIFNPMLLFGSILTYFIFEFYINHFHCFSNSENDLTDSKIGKVLIYTFILYLLVPSIIYKLHYILTNEHYFNINLISQLYMYDGLRGISLDRVQYSFLVGLAILLVIFFKHNLMFYFFGTFLAYTLYLGGTRATLLATIIAVLFYYRKKKIVFISFVTILILTSIYIAYGARGGFLDPFREFILIESVKKIFEGGLSTFLFGHGYLYVISDSGHQPHNWFLQSVMNFGIIMTLIWISYLIDFFKKLNNYAATIMIYCFGFGLFHNGFSIWVYIPTTLFGYMLILSLNKNSVGSMQG